jgi:lysophospholipase L1-like esterase
MHETKKDEVKEGDFIKMKKWICSLITAGALFSTSSATFAETLPDLNIEYVALGDSIPAGMTPYGSYALSYPDYLLNHFQNGNSIVDYNNFSVSGYTSDQLKDDLKANTIIQNEIKEATHITLTIGANDLFQRLLSDPSTAYEGITTASENLQMILTAIDELNPNVEVYVMGYYNPFAYYPEQVQDFLVPLIDALNVEIEKRTEANGDTYVPTGDRIDPHYKKYMPNPEDNHLNIEGYKVIAQEFWKAIRQNR